MARHDTADGITGIIGGGSTAGGVPLLRPAGLSSARRDRYALGSGLVRRGLHLRMTPGFPGARPLSRAGTRPVIYLFTQRE